MKSIKEIIEMLEERIIDANLLSVAIPYIIEYLKALEIIRKHKLLNYVIKNYKCASMYKLSEEEIKLLKEIHYDNERI